MPCSSMGKNTNQKKYAVPKRAVIGKIHPANTSLMFPNEKFAGFQPDITINTGLMESRCITLRLRKRFNPSTGVIYEPDNYRKPPGHIFFMSSFSKESVDPRNPLSRSMRWYTIDLICPLMFAPLWDAHHLQYFIVPAQG